MNKSIGGKNNQKNTQRKTKKGGNSQQAKAIFAGMAISLDLLEKVFLTGKVETGTVAEVFNNELTKLQALTVKASKALSGLSGGGFLDRFRRGPEIILPPVLLDKIRAVKSVINNIITTDEIVTTETIMRVATLIKALTDEWNNYAADNYRGDVCYHSKEFLYLLNYGNVENYGNNEPVKLKPSSSLGPQATDLELSPDAYDYDEEPIDEQPTTGGKRRVQKKRVNKK